jgi:hypothetical protein
MSAIINFELERERRLDAESNDSQVECEQLRSQLVDLIADSGLSDSAVVSATMRALVETLEQGPASPRRPYVKALIARSLKTFRV